MATTVDRVKNLVAEHQFIGRKPVPVNEVNLDRTFDDMGLDSLDVTELVMDFEDEFSCNVTDEDAETLKKPADLVAYVAKHDLENING